MEGRAILSEDQKSFPEEVTLNFRKHRKGGGEDGDEEGHVIRRLGMQAGLEDHALHSMGNGNQSEGQFLNPICAQTQLSLTASCIQQTGEKWPDGRDPEKVERTDSWLRCT